MRSGERGAREYALKRNDAPLDDAVHPVDLAFPPGMLGLCQRMIAIVEGAGIFEGMRVEEPPLGVHLLDLSWEPGFVGGIGEKGFVVGEDG